MMDYLVIIGLIIAIIIALKSTIKNKCYHSCTNCINKEKCKNGQKSKTIN